MSLYLLAGLCEDLEVNKNYPELQYEALLKYFAQVSDIELSMVVASYYHYEFKKIVSTPKLKKWITEHSKLPAWLIKESKDAVGDLLETLALFVHQKETNLKLNLLDVTNSILLIDKNSAEAQTYILQSLAQLDNQSKILFLKLTSSKWRLPVEEFVLLQALALFFNKKATAIAAILQQVWNPITTGLSQLLLATNSSKSYSLLPFAYYENYFEAAPASITLKDWIVEQKYNGVRVQVIVTEQGVLNIWTSDAVLIQNTFPEFAYLNNLPNGTIIDAVLCATNSGVSVVKKNIEKIITKKTKTKIESQYSYELVCLDLLYYNDVSLLEQTKLKRLAALREAVIAVSISEALNGKLQLPNLFTFKNSSQLIEFVNSNSIKALVLHHKKAAYYNTINEYNSLIIKAERQTIFATLIYVARANGPLFYHELTVAVFKADDLVPFAKVINNLDEENNHLLNEYIKANKRERLGPVTTVPSGLVVKLSYQSIQESNTHKHSFLVIKPLLISIEWNAQSLELIYKM